MNCTSRSLMYCLIAKMSKVSSEVPQPTELITYFKKGGIKYGRKVKAIPQTIHLIRRESSWKKTHMKSRIGYEQTVLYNIVKTNTDYSNRIRRHHYHQERYYSA